MEQITRKNGILYYGDRQCSDINDAYSYFRDDFNANTGTNSWGKLNRVGQRSERIHGYGYVFSKPVKNPVPHIHGSSRINYRLLGLIGISYCRIIGCWDFPKVDEDTLDKWLDWALSKGSGVLRLVGKKDKSGRTSKFLKQNRLNFKSYGRKK